MRRMKPRISSRRSLPDLSRKIGQVIVEKKVYLNSARSWGLTRDKNHDYTEPPQALSSVPKQPALPLLSNTGSSSATFLS